MGASASTSSWASGQSAVPAMRPLLLCSGYRDHRQVCVRHGAHYVLVDGEKVYALEGHRDQLERLAGERANVVGTLEGDTIKVKAVVTE